MNGKAIIENKEKIVVEKVKTGVVLELTNDEAQTILNRFTCSSFKTYDTYRKENNIPHYSRKGFLAALKTAIGQ